MFEHDIPHRLGKKTFYYLYIVYGWWLSLAAIASGVLGGMLWFGPFKYPVDQFFRSNDWYVTATLFGQWFVLLGVTLLFFAYIRVRMLHRFYKFMVSKHAFHVHRGWFSVRETTIHYHHITNVHIVRPYHYRMFGVAKLDIITASDRDSERTDTKRRAYLIPVIDVKIARDLSRYLLEQAELYQRSARPTRVDQFEDNNEEFEDEDENIEDSDVDELEFSGNDRR